MTPFSYCALYIFLYIFHYIFLYIFLYIFFLVNRGPGLSRCSFIPSIPHGERQVNPWLTSFLSMPMPERSHRASGREQEQRGSTPSPTSKMTTTTTTERIGFLSPIPYRYWKIDASLALSLLHTSLPRSREKGSLIETFPPLSEGEWTPGTQNRAFTWHVKRDKKSL